jgi:hypothetical protein
MATIIWTDGKGQARLWQDGKVLANGFVVGCSIVVGDIPQIETPINADPVWLESPKTEPVDGGVSFDSRKLTLPKAEISSMTELHLSFAHADRGILPRLTTTWLPRQEPLYIEFPSVASGLLNWSDPIIKYTRIGGRSA